MLAYGYEESGVVVGFELGHSSSLHSFKGSSEWNSSYRLRKEERTVVRHSSYMHYSLEYESQM